MESLSPSETQGSSQIVLSSEGRPVVNPNIPAPKDVVGKVKVKTVSSKTQVRYRSSENPQEFMDCDPQYKITRFWNASVAQEIVPSVSSFPAPEAITYEEKPLNLLGNSTKSCAMSVDSKLSRISLVSWSSMSLYEKAFLSSFSCDSINDDDNAHQPQFVKIMTPLRDSNAVHLNPKGSLSEFDVNCTSKKFHKSYSVPAICIKESEDEIQEIEKKEYQSSNNSLQENYPTPFLYSSLNASISKTPDPKTLVKTSYSISIPCEYEETPFEGSGFEEIPHEEVEEVPEKEDSIKIARTVIVEKKLQYITNQDPSECVSPKTLTRKFDTIECIDPQCKHTCYFTGMGRVGLDVLQDISIFGVDKYDHDRIETRLRTTIMSEINPINNEVKDSMQSFIDRHNLNDDISHSFRKLGEDQISKDDPRVIKVSEVVTVAEVNTIEPEELFKEKS